MTRAQGRLPLHYVKSGPVLGHLSRFGAADVGEPTSRIMLTGKNVLLADDFGDLPSKLTSGIVRASLGVLETQRGGRVGHCTAEFDLVL